MGFRLLFWFQVLPSIKPPRLISVADHPRPRGRKTLGAALGSGHLAPRLLLVRRAAAATGAVRGLVLIERLRRVRTALVGGVGLALVGGHAEERGRGQDHARRFTFALRTVLRRVAFGHRPHVGERAAIVAEIFVDRHFSFPRAKASQRWMRGGRYAPSRTPSPRDYLSCDSGIWM